MRQRFGDRLRGRRDDAGTSMTELMVVMFVFGILLAACLTLYIGSLRTATATQARLDEVNDGRIAVSAMSRSLRTAILPRQLPGGSDSTEESAFIEATPNSIRFFANVNNEDNAIGASKVSYFVDADGTLQESTQPPDPRTPANPGIHYCTPGPTCPVATKVLARDVVLGTNPLFVYYDQLGNKLAGTSLTAEQLENVDAVDIQVTTKQERAYGAGSTYVLRVAMPNHDSVVRGGEDD